MRVRSGLMIAAVFALMVWLAAAHDNWRYAYELTGQKTDYYNLLVDGLLDGHLYMKVDVPEGLLSPDPAVRAKTPFLLDVSLYQGRYYLYFGVVPAALLMLPYSWATGHDMPQNLAVLILVFVGFLLQYRVWADARRRYFPGLGAGTDVLSICFLAIALPTTILLKDRGVYQIAIAGAYTFLSLAWFGLYHALHRPERAARWLALASLGGGLAVGCRPTSGVVLPVLGVVVLWFAWRQRLEWRRWLVLGAATAGPAMIVGLLLMGYNYGRFDDPFEFGFRYQLADLIMNRFPLSRAEFMLPNLRWYYGMPPALTPHFPWVEPLDAAVRPKDYYGYEAIYGQWLTLVAMVVAGVGAWRSWRRRGAWPFAFGASLAALGVSFLLLLLTMSTFGFRADRYVVDFQGTLVLALVLTGGYSAGVLASALADRLWRIGWRCVMAAACLFNVLISLDHMHLFEHLRSGSFKTLAYYGNYPSLLLQRLGVISYGPARLTVSFPEEPDPLPMPLVATGHSREGDVLSVQRHGDGSLEFALEHAMHGIVLSNRLDLEPKPEHVVEIEMGSLFPPRWHPFFNGWDGGFVEAAKTTMRVTVDGRPVLDGAVQFHEASPFSVVLAKSPLHPDRTFQGRVALKERLPVTEDVYRQAAIGPGIWRLQLEVNFAHPGLPLPVLASGISGAGNLLSLEPSAEGTIEFRFDQWGVAFTKSGALPVEKGVKVVDVLVGPQIGGQDWQLEDELRERLPQLRDTLEVWLDGERVWTTPLIAHQDSYGVVAIGTNPQGFSTATQAYLGQMRRTALSPEEVREILVRSLQSLPENRQ